PSSARRARAGRRRGRRPLDAGAGPRTLRAERRVLAPRLSAAARLPRAPADWPDRALEVPAAWLDEPRPRRPNPPRPPPRRSDAARRPRAPAPRARRVPGPRGPGRGAFRVRPRDQGAI